MKHIAIFRGMLVIICLSQLTCLAAIIRVPADQPTIQAGINAAVDGDTVLVADGVYSEVETKAIINFKSKSITVISENGPEACIVDCKNQYYVGGCYFENVEGEKAILDGFTIRNSSSEAIELLKSRPIINNCIIRDNHACGVCCFSSHPIVTNCSIIDNGGSGVGCAEGSNPTFIDCIISRNRSSKNGGGLCTDMLFASFTCINCLISDNTARFDGGGCFGSLIQVKLVNCTIVNNIAGKNGGGIHGPFTLVNCTIAHNQADIGGGFYSHRTGVAPEAKNCIFWGNDPDQIYSSPFSCEYSDIQGGYRGIGNIDSDPLFINVEAADYRLSSESPCVDAGTDSEDLEHDADNNPRFCGGAIDIGAYEYQGWPSIPRAYVNMPSHVIRPGDRVKCLATVWNPYDKALSDHRLFVILDVHDHFFMAPSFSEFDWYPWTFGPGRTSIFVLPEFKWPNNVGSACDVFWHAFLADVEMNEFTSPISLFSFGWSN